MYRAADGQVLFRDHPLAPGQAQRILILHRQSAERAAAEQLDGLAAAACALADELEAAILGCSTAPVPSPPAGEGGA